MRRVILCFLVFVLMFALIGCQRTSAESVTLETPETNATAAPSPSATPENNRIGISMPSQNFMNWAAEGSAMKAQLEAMGYAVDLMFADDYDFSRQVSQIEEMITRGCRVLLIASVDQLQIDTVLTKAKEADVTVIAYDMMIYQTSMLDYCVTFDYAGFGGLQAEYIVNTLGLKDANGPFTIELFVGDPGDANMPGPRDSALDVLQPYIDNGQLVVKSGQADFYEITTVNYSSENAKARMDQILDEFYTPDQPDAVLAISDSISIGIIESLEDAGCTTFPIITGSGGYEASLTAIKDSKQAMSLYEDRDILVSKALEMANAVMTGHEVPVNSYVDNAVKDIPTFKCKPVVVTSKNVQEIMSKN